VRILALTLAAMLLAGASAAEAQPAPALLINAPEELAAARNRLESFDRSPLAGIVRMTGLADPGPPIHVIVAAENSAAAAGVSASTAGYAIGESGLIVLFPARSPVYPHDTLEDVLRHEVAHVLISRAARGQPVPRWFHEGLAVAAERPWGLEDRSRLVWELMAGPRLTVGDIDRLFDSESSRPRAYSLSAAMVREMLRAHGPSAPAAILRELGAGAAFETAVVRVTGRPMSAAEREFWDRQRVWTVWVPLFTSGDVLWLGVIGLAALAVWHRRKRAAAIRRRWDEEAADAERLHPPDDRTERGDD
jgi:hypothetical protein